MKNSEMGSREPENERGKKLAEIFKALEDSFERVSETLLTILEPSGGLRESTVFIKGFENGMLFVSEPESPSIMGIRIDDVRGAKSIGGPKKSTDPYIIRIND
jgi:hypothetical protein